MPLGGGRLDSSKFEKPYASGIYARLRLEGHGCRSLKPKTLIMRTIKRVRSRSYAPE